MKIIYGQHDIRIYPFALASLDERDPDEANELAATGHVRIITSRHLDRFGEVQFNFSGGYWTADEWKKINEAMTLAFQITAAMK